MLKAACVPHVRTQGIRHRATNNIANLGMPAKVCMKLTEYKTVAMYFYTGDKPVRNAAGLVASRRQAIMGVRRSAEAQA